VSAMSPHVRSVWDGFAVSLRGSGHEQSGQPCQDTSLYLLPRADTCVLIVADGAGSSSLGQIGSAAAVDAAQNVLARRLLYWRPEGEPAWEALLLECFREARLSLEELAGQHHSPIREFSTTLTAVALCPGFAAAASIGDCAGVVGIDGGGLVLLAAPEHGEYANETRFLSQTRWEAYFRFYCLHAEATMAAVFSDSLEHIALCRSVPYEPFISDTVAFAASQPPEDRVSAYRTFLEKVIKGKRTEDDISIVVAWRAEVDA